MKPKFTAERIVPAFSESEDGRLMYLRHRFAYEEVARRLSSAGLVIDIGCGEGYGSAILASAADRVIGFDVDADSVRHAERSYGQPGRCEFRPYDGERIPLQDGIADAAVSFQVIEHVVDEQSFVAQAARVIRSDGLCILTTPNRLLRLGPGERPWNRYHVREYDASGLHQLLRSHFRNVLILGVAGDPETQAHELARLAWVRRTAAKDPLYLRRLLPESVKRRLLGLLRGRQSGKSSGLAVAEWGTDRYCVTSEADTALDLFAICTK